jgi:hypothetical protein
MKIEKSKNSIEDAEMIEVNKADVPAAVVSESQIKSVELKPALPFEGLRA